jgi:alpha-galactosidase
MFGRIHQSGFLPLLSPESFAQVRNGISVYKQEIRSHIPTLTPYYPLGMADVTEPTQPAALGMRGPVRSFMAVWRRDGPEEVHLSCRFSDARLLYPVDLGIQVRRSANACVVRFPRRQMGAIITD